MTRTEIKQRAQDEILHYARAAMNAIEEDRDLSEDEQDALYSEVDIQIKRVKKMFGYE